MKPILSWAVSLTCLFAARTVLAYESAPVQGAASIQGVVSAGGTIPAPRQMLITKNPEVCGTGTRDVAQVRVSGSALEGAVVYLEKVEKGKPWSIPPDGFLIDQKGCRFLPLLLVMPRDKSLKIRNSDPVLHNMHTYELIGSARRTLFNLGQPEQGSVIEKDVRVRRSPFVKVECDAHDFMEGWIFAAENPYYAVTGPDGRFAIDGVPPGAYTLKIWHPILGEVGSPVAVEAGKSATVNFKLEGRP